MANIKVFSSDATVFTSNGLGVLNECIKAEITEGLNGEFELMLEHPLDTRGKWKNLIDDNIIYADGQPFRIYRKKKNTKKISVWARHIVYDLLDNFIKDLNLGSVSALNALIQIISDTNTQYPNPFTSTGDATGTGVFDFQKMNPIECLLGKKGIVATAGGEVQFDNYVITLHNQRGASRGVMVAYGKNIEGIEESIDRTGMATRLYPIGKDDLVISTNDGYVDSDYVLNYPHPIVRKIEFKDIETEGALSAAAEAYFVSSGCDFPIVNYKVDFVELSKTEEFKDYSVLQTMYLGDTLIVKHSVMDLDLNVRVIRTVKDCITDRIIKIELGSFVKSVADSIDVKVKDVETEIEVVRSAYQIAIENATNLITGESGGFVKIICDEVTGEPEGIAIMDTDDVLTAQKVWLWNNSGLGYSSTGIGGTYTTAITNDGQIVANVITSGQLNANIIKTGVLESFNEVSWIDMATGSFNLGNMITFDGSAFEIDFTGTDLATASSDINVQKLNANGKTITTNGEFIDTSGWTASNTTLSVATVSELKCATGATKHATAGATQVLATVVGHLYYIAAEIKPLYSRATEFGFSGLTKATIASPTINVWNRKGIISTANATNHTLYLSHNTLSQYATGDIFRFKAPIVVDLTLLYGAGNEPDLAWCDANINYNTIASGIIKAGFNEVSANVLVDEEGMTITDGALLIQNSSSEDCLYIDSNGRLASNTYLAVYDNPITDGGTMIIPHGIYDIPPTTGSSDFAIETDGWVEVLQCDGLTYTSVRVDTVSILGYYIYPDTNGIDLQGNTWCCVDLGVGNDLHVWGSNKTRVVQTDSCGNVCLNAYETADPMFGDIGGGKIVNGECLVAIDSIFAETVHLDLEYHVFLQAYGDGRVYVSERTPTHFVVKGTEGLEFAWELKAKQKDNMNQRLEVLPMKVVIEKDETTTFVDMQLNSPYNKDMTYEEVLREV